MRAEFFLKTYSDIEVHTVIRKEKLRKMEALFLTLEKEKNSFSVGEIFWIARQLLSRQIVIRQPLFLYLLYPVLSEQVAQNNVEAIKLLMNFEQQLIAHRDYTKEEKYTGISLMEQGLKLAPNDPELLHLYERKLGWYISHTLHEIPTGVLYNMDGASIEECEVLLQTLNDYEQVCSKLGEAQSAFIEEARYYYNAYRDYLEAHQDYINFKAYLSQQPKGYPVQF